MLELVILLLFVVIAAAAGSLYYEKNKDKVDNKLKQMKDSVVQQNNNVSKKTVKGDLHGRSKTTYTVNGKKYDEAELSEQFIKDFDDAMKSMDKDMKKMSKDMNRSISKINNSLYNTTTKTITKMPRARKVKADDLPDMQTTVTIEELKKKIEALKNKK
jgi:septation ring formation regulator EzrA